MDNISIRSAGPDDLSTVAELRWRWARENGTRPVTSREEFVGAFLAWAQQNRESHRCLVALRDGVIVGMAWLATLRRVPHPGSLDRSSADLQCVYVVPEQRNAGLGGRLIDAVLAHAGDLDD
jgi:GNAT superfamily N-acetyltransferase